MYLGEEPRTVTPSDPGLVERLETGIAATVREIDELRAENARLRKLIDGVAAVLGVHIEIGSDRAAHWTHTTTRTGAEMTNHDTAQWWTCDSPEELQISLTSNVRGEEDPYLLNQPPIPVSPIHDTTITVNGEPVICHQSPEGDQFLAHTNPGGRVLSSLSIYAERPPTAGVWRSGR